jgi:hypothetical protein
MTGDFRRFSTSPYSRLLLIMQGAWNLKPVKADRKANVILHTFVARTLRCAYGMDVLMLFY